MHSIVLHIKCIIHLIRMFITHSITIDVIFSISIHSMYTHINMQFNFRPFIQNQEVEICIYRSPWSPYFVLLFVFFFASLVMHNRLIHHCKMSTVYFQQSSTFELYQPIRMPYTFDFIRSILFAVYLD